MSAAVARMPMENERSVKREVLRDQFAISALSGLLVRGSCEQGWAARTAYRIADEMLAERDKDAL